MFFLSQTGSTRKRVWGNTNLDIINFSDGLVLIATFLFGIFLETCCLRCWPLYQVMACRNRGLVEKVWNVFSCTVVEIRKHNYVGYMFVDYKLLS